LRAARANPVFCADKKRIRTENRALNKIKNSFELFLSKIGDPRVRLPVRATAQLRNSRVCNSR
jgi:hypothetical protein